MTSHAKTKFKPNGDRILVLRAKADDKSKGGIIIPDISKERPVEGVVLAVGPGKWEEGGCVEVDFKPGDHVLFGKYAGTEIALPDVDGELVVLREDDILGTL